MPTVGPELPAHLVKRKRSIDDDAEGSGSPPHKIQAATAPGPDAPPSRNPEELDIDSSSEDDYGPSIQPTKTSGPSLPAQTAGPSLPPSHNPDELNIDDSSDDDYGPSFRPSNPKSPPRKRVLGPSLPPAPLSEMPSHPANDSSDSEDDYGPSLPPAPGSAAESTMLQQQRRQQESEEQERLTQAAAKPQRDDWMMVPPSDSDWSSRVDPTKLKNRKFQSGKGAKGPSERGGGISAIWTETPEQKRQRLEDEVLGRKDAATSSHPHSNPHGNASRGGTTRLEDEATARRIQEYNEKNRNRSLYDEHKGQTPREKEDDPSKRGFDREKDMALGGRLGHSQKKEMLTKAADFGSRFQKGKYL